MPAPPAVDNFPAYQAQCRTLLRPILTDAPPGSLDEHAFPAYLEGNALSRWLFWRRIRAAYDYIGRIKSTASPHDACLDFGCGSGLMLPRLRQVFPAVYGVDIAPAPARRFLDAWPDPALRQVRVVTDILTIDVPPHTLDLVLALDVLEHISDLDPFIRRFAELLRPAGTLLVSGPTENFLYRLGRKIVGFSGHYHVHDIAAVAAAMRRHFTVRIVRRLYPPVPLFWILEARPRA